MDSERGRQTQKDKKNLNKQPEISVLTEEKLKQETSTQY